MSLKTLPVLFLNLGGEMMYILDQRLRAQNIPDEKAKKGKCCWCQVFTACPRTTLSRRFHFIKSKVCLLEYQRPMF